MLRSGVMVLGGGDLVIRFLSKELPNTEWDGGVTRLLPLGESSDKYRGLNASTGDAGKAIIIQVVGVH